MLYKVPQVGKRKVSEGRYTAAGIAGALAILAFLYCTGFMSYDLGRVLGVSPFVIVGAAVVLVLAIGGPLLYVFTKQYHATVGDPNRWSEEGVEEFARLLSAQHGVTGFDAQVARSVVSKYELHRTRTMENIGWQAFPERFASAETFLVRQADGVEVEVQLGRDQRSRYGKPEDGDWELVYASSNQYVPLPRAGGPGAR